MSGTVGAVSDYRYRGITLSDRKPAAQGAVAYDDPLGWYAGAFVSTVRVAPPEGINAQVIGYAGYASRLPWGVSLEAGGDYSAFTGASGDDYGEIFLGAAADNVSARLYYSPRYFRLRSDNWYGEINASLPFLERARVLLHVGLSRTRYPAGYRYAPPQNVVDGRIGLGVDFDEFRVELAWVGISAAYAAYAVTGTSSPNTVVLSLSRSF